MEDGEGGEDRGWRMRRRMVRGGNREWGRRGRIENGGVGGRMEDGG